MNKIFILSLLIFFSGFSFAQKISADKVPAAVKSKFSSLYPATVIPVWEKENGNYEAAFQLNKKKMSVLIDPMGNLKETETFIQVAELPAAAKQYVEKNKAGAKIAEASRIVDSNGRITFEAEVNGKDMVFDEKGNFVK